MKFRNAAKKYGARAAGVGTGVLAVVAPSFATGTTSYLDGSVSGMFTQVQTDFGTLNSYAWPVVVLILGTFIVLKLTKKTGNKVG